MADNKSGIASLTGWRKGMADAHEAYASGGPIGASQYPMSSTPNAVYSEALPYGRGYADGGGVNPTDPGLYGLNPDGSPLGTGGFMMPPTGLNPDGSPLGTGGFMMPPTGSGGTLPQVDQSYSSNDDNFKPYYSDDQSGIAQRFKDIGGQDAGIGALRNFVAQHPGNSLSDMVGGQLAQDSSLRGDFGIQQWTPPAAGSYTPAATPNQTTYQDQYATNRAAMPSSAGLGSYIDALNKRLLTGPTYASRTIPWQKAGGSGTGQEPVRAQIPPQVPPPPDIYVPNGGVGTNLPNPPAPVTPPPVTPPPPPDVYVPNGGVGTDLPTPPPVEKRADTGVDVLDSSNNWTPYTPEPDVYVPNGGVGTDLPPPVDTKQYNTGVDVLDSSDNWTPYTPEPPVYVPNGGVGTDLPPPVDTKQYNTGVDVLDNNNNWNPYTPEPPAQPDVYVPNNHSTPIPPRAVITPEELGAINTPAPDSSISDVEQQNYLTHLANDLTYNNGLLGSTYDSYYGPDTTAISNSLQNQGLQSLTVDNSLFGDMPTPDLSRPGFFDSVKGAFDSAGNWIADVAADNPTAAKIVGGGAGLISGGLGGIAGGLTGANTLINKGNANDIPSVDTPIPPIESGAMTPAEVDAYIMANTPAPDLSTKFNMNMADQDVTFGPGQLSDTYIDRNANMDAVNFLGGFGGSPTAMMDPASMVDPGQPGGWTAPGGQSFWDASAAMRADALANPPSVDPQVQAFNDSVAAAAAADTRTPEEKAAQEAQTAEWQAQQDAAAAAITPEQRAQQQAEADAYMQDNAWMYGGQFAKGGGIHGGLGSTHEYKAGGRLLRGPGDGMSDSIPAVIKGPQPQRAALADGEFVIPADVVSHLGNGSTEAGSKHLYSMMDKIRHARTGNKQQGRKINPGKFLPG